jgi:hypothetical protein
MEVEVPIARVWTDPRDGKKWVVEKWDGGNGRRAWGGRDDQTVTLRFSNRRECRSVRIRTDTPLEGFTSNQLRRFFDQAGF